MRVAAVLALSLLGCAPFRSRIAPPSEPERRFMGAVAALDRADFAAARPDLTWLVARCSAAGRGRTAVLLFAAAELDLGNPEGSAEVAAHLARAYLRLPWVVEEEVPLARTLYLLALDRTHTEPADTTEPAAPLPSVATRFDHCDGGGVPEWSRGLPPAPARTTADSLAALDVELHAALDSLAAVRGRSGEQATRVRQLEAELQRIRKLLGVPPDTSRVRR